MAELLAIDCGNPSRQSRDPYISKLQPFLSFTESSHQPQYTKNDVPALMDFTFGRLERFQNYVGLMWDAPKLSPPQSTLLRTTLISSVVIDIDNYLDTYHLTP